MTRTIRFAILLLTAISIFQVKSAAADDTPVFCLNNVPATGDAAGQVTNSPMFKAMQSKLGNVISCSQSVEDGQVTAKFTFPNNSVYTATLNPAIEYSEQELSTSMLSDQEALSLLKQTETEAFGKQGCKIGWKHPEIKQNKEAITTKSFVGNACNCQGLETFSNGKLIGLIFSSAC